MTKKRYKTQINNTEVDKIYFKLGSNLIYTFLERQQISLTFSYTEDDTYVLSTLSVVIQS